MSVAAFDSKAGKLVLEKFATRNLEYDYANEDGWLPAVNGALREMSSELRFGGVATLIIPGYQLLTKLIKIPHVDEAKQQQIIAFEAQQSIPYPLHEVAWGSQVVDDDGVESEVILIAMKLDAANRFCNAAGIPGVKPQMLQASSLMDYNAFRLANPEGGEHTLLVNVGGRSTNLTFVGASGVFLRNVSYGGNNLTQMLADTLGTTFAQAERAKVDFFSGQTGFSADDPAHAPLQQTAQSWMRRLSQEITKSIMAFRRQSPNNQAPQQILLTGRSSLLPGLSQFLAEANKISVDYFNPAAALEIGSGVDAQLVEASAYQMTELVGEGARLVLPKSLGINLLPRDRVQANAFAKKKPFLVLAAACLALAPTGLLLYYPNQTAAYQKASSELEAKIRPLQAVQSELQKEQKAYDSSRSDLAQLEGLVASRTNWIELFGEFQQRLGELKDVWLEDLTVVREKELTPLDPANPKAVRKETGKSIYRLEIGGRMLIRNFDDPEAMEKTALSRVNALLEGLKKSPFVGSVEQGAYSSHENRRIVSFKFNILVNPEKPL